jgi:hypothetical protein
MRRYELCSPGDNQLIGFPLNNGTWTGVIGQLMREVSVIIYSLTNRPTICRRNGVTGRIEN